MICQVSELSFTGTRYLNSGIRYQPRYQNSENQVLVIPVPALCLIQVQVYLVPASIPIPGSAQPLDRKSLEKKVHIQVGIYSFLNVKMIVLIFR